MLEKRKHIKKHNLSLFVSYCQIIFELDERFKYIYADKKNKTKNKKTKQNRYQPFIFFIKEKIG